jgi:hypothetical protein
LGAKGVENDVYRITEMREIMEVVPDYYIGEGKDEV